MTKRWLALSTLFLAFLGSGAAWWNSQTRPSANRAAPDRTHPQPQFVDIAHPAGVDFTYFRGETGEFWITETTGGGVALVDYDGDGWLDILVANGCRQPPTGEDREHTCQLFRNQQDGTFSEVTVPAGVAYSGYGQGCYALDFDNDGFDELYLTCWGPNAFYRNHGDGTFTREMELPGAATHLYSTGAAPGDFDRDGCLDLFVANYVDFDFKHQPRCGDPRTGVRGYCGPIKFGPTPSVLYQNRGDGSFEDVSRSSQIVLPDGTARPHSKGLGAVAADFDNDGKLDVYVANDLEPNFLFMNRCAGPGHPLSFEEVALAKGAATSAEGAAQSSMGIACADYDGDGHLDLLVTNFYLEGVTLYRNLGEVGFLDDTRAAGLLGPTRGVLGWGAGFLDYDNDGRFDLFLTNGHVQPGSDPGVPYAMPAQLFRHGAGGRFVDVSAFAGGYFQKKWNGRGAAFGDIDNDGDTDIVVVHHHQPMAILRNDTKTANHWLQFELVGRASDRNAIGARLIAEVNGQKLVREVSSAGSYLSSSDRRILLGLGTASRVERIEVRWLSGAVQELRDIAPDQRIRLTEGLPPKAREEPGMR